MRRKNNIFLCAICASLCVCGNAHSAFKIEKASFPLTADDISFSDKMDLLAADYKNYEGLSPYEVIHIENAEQKRQRDQENMSHDEYCQEYPLDDICNPTPETEAAVMASGYSDTDDTTTNYSPDYATYGADAVSGTTPSYNITVANSQNFSRTTADATGVSDNSVVGGVCTPSERHSYYDKGDWHKLTSHRYDVSNPPFAKAMFNLLRVERPECHKFSGKYGGMTCYGYASRSHPDIDVTKLTLNTAEDRTYKMYYKDIGINKLPDHIMGDVMHASFWRGPAKGVKTLYTVLGVSCGGQCGTVSDALVTAAKNYRGDLHSMYWNQAWSEITSYESNRKFLKGFGERVQMARKNGCHSPNTNPITF